MVFPASLFVLFQLQACTIHVLLFRKYLLHLIIIRFYFILFLKTSSTVLSSYSVVFVYMLLMNTLLTPLRCMIFYFLVKRMKNESPIRNILIRCLPVAMRPFHEVPPLSTLLRQLGRDCFATIYRCCSCYCCFTSQANKGVVDSENRESLDTITRNSRVKSSPMSKSSLILDVEIFVAEIATSFFIIVTFGLAFPPLAILALLSITSQSYCTELMIGRLYRKAQSRCLVNYLKCIDRDCRGVAAVLNRCLRSVFLLGFLFFGFFIYDIFGSTSYFWASIIIAVLPVPFYTAKYIYRYFEVKYERKFLSAVKVWFHSCLGHFKPSLHSTGDSSLADRHDECAPRNFELSEIHLNPMSRQTELYRSDCHP